MQTNLISILALLVPGLVSAQPVAETISSVPVPLRLVVANGNSSAPAISDDGAFVVFVSAASNLAPFDTNRKLDVFRRDLRGNATLLVSVNPLGSSGNGDSVCPNISGNGRYIVFESVAGDLVTDDNNNDTDIFVRDMNSAVTSLVSVNRFGHGSGNQRSYNPRMTADGRYVLFESRATDLVADPGTGREIFLRDLVQGTTIMVSTNGLRGFSRDAQARDAILSPDGHFAAYLSEVTNTTYNPNKNVDLYFRDLVSGQTSLGSIYASNYIGAACTFDNLAFNSNGTRLAFRAIPTGPTYWSVIFSADLSSGIHSVVCSNSYFPASDAAGPVVCGDGRTVAFENRTNVWFWNLDRQTSFPLFPQEMTATPLLSLDGATVAFLCSHGSDATNELQMQLFACNFLTGSTNQISVMPAGDAADRYEIASPSMAPDGRHFVFEAFNTNLVSKAGYRVSEIYFRDLNQPTAQLVSVAMPQSASATPLSWSFAEPGGLSRNGQWVVFTSLADNLASQDANGWSDVYVRDLQTARTILVSVNTNGVSGSGPSFSPVISGDGRRVVFRSAAADLTPGDTNYLMDLFVRDLQLSNTFPLPYSAITTTPFRAPPTITDDGLWISYEGRDNPTDSSLNAYLFNTQSGTVTALHTNSHGFSPVLAPNGLFVAFATNSSSLTVPVYSNLFVRELSSGLTDTVVPGAPCSPAIFSADGRWLVYSLYSTNFATNASLYLYDAMAKTNLLITSGAAARQRPSLSSDGSKVAYSSAQAYSASLQRSTGNVYVFDRLLGTNILVSVNFSGAGFGDGVSDSPTVSGDGRWITFRSTASNLIAGNTNRKSNVYLRDLATGTTSLLSANPHLVPGDDASIRPYLSADGNVVLYGSASTDLVADDGNVSADLFLFRLPRGSFIDTDHDGMDDNWERKYFGDLSQDGTGDSDGDGISDLAEFRAGTDPTDPTSAFRGGLLNPPASGPVTLQWPARPGYSYKIQFKNALSDALWSDLSTTVSVGGGVAQASDTTVGMVQRFYRIAVVP